MSFRMKMNTSELDKWVSNQAYRETAKKQALVIMKNSIVDKVVEELKEHNVTNELETSVVGTATSEKIEIRSNMYGEIVLEYGRRPGKFPPVEPLEQWAVNRGMGKGVGYLIARKIARMGTKKFREGGPKQLTKIEEWLGEKEVPERMVKLLEAFTK